MAGIWSSPIDDCRLSRRCVVSNMPGATHKLQTFIFSIASITSNIRRQKCSRLVRRLDDVRAIMSRVKLNAFHQTHPWRRRRLLVTQQKVQLEWLDGVESYAWLEVHATCHRICRQLDDLKIVSHATIKSWNIFFLRILFILIII